MLDEEEFAKVQQVHNECTEAVKQYRREYRVSLAETPVDELYQAVHEIYKQLTGTTGFTTDEILKHRISLYGRPCPICRKPLRTLKASKCYECGAGIASVVEPTDPAEEQLKGRIALWLDPQDIRFLASHCSCPVDAGEVERERCARIRFRASAALHRAGVKSEGEEAV
jgi:hypothetical protein